jgi:uncharacterized protein (DUF488 family)
VAKSVWTIGHSTRSLSAFIRLLQAHGIRVLADVRSLPYSRRNPQFNADTLPKSLKAAGVAYRHLPGLGGRRAGQPASPHRGWKNPGFRGYADYMDTPAFSSALDHLINLATESETAIMCAEAVPWRCHRSLIADALLVSGWTVLHIMNEAQAEPHHLPPWARVEDGRLAYPGESELPAATLF